MARHGEPQGFTKLTMSQVLLSYFHNRVDERPFVYLTEMYLHQKQVSATVIFNYPCKVPYAPRLP
eukprot:scaffold129607_cov18-Prasinocladus_malaysianus.AAC.1